MTFPNEEITTRINLRESGYLRLVESAARPGRGREFEEEATTQPLPANEVLQVSAGELARAELKRLRAVIAERDTEIAALTRLLERALADKRTLIDCAVLEAK